MSTTDPTTIPQGTPVIAHYELGSLDDIWFKTSAPHGFSNSLSPESRSGIRLKAESYTMLAPIPDGMDPDEAERILADEAVWVPLPGGPGEKHIGARVRSVTERENGSRRVTEGVLTRTSEGSVIVSAVVLPTSYATWFIHRDDVPAPEPDVIERAARAMVAELGDDWDAIRGEARTEAITTARQVRAALAVFNREQS